MEAEDFFNEFKRVTLDVADELGIKSNVIEFEKYEDKVGKFNYQASGVGNKYYFEWRVDNTQLEDKTSVWVFLSDSSPPGEDMFSFGEILDGAKNLARIAGGALHKFNIKRNPVDLERMFAGVPLYILGTRETATGPLIEILLSGIPSGKGNELEVYKFRHAERSIDWYRYCSYLFKIHSTYGSFLAAFPWLGALDSGSYHYVRFADMQIENVRNRGGKVTIKNYDVEYDDLQLYLVRHSISFQDYLEPELEIDQIRLPSFDAFGIEFEEEWNDFLRKFYKRDLRNSLGDIRPLVQDALRIACEQIDLKISDIDDPDPNKLIGQLIGHKIVDGRFQEWTRTFTAFSNIGSHSKTMPTNEELEDKIIRKRIVLTILLGVHLIQEVEISVDRINSL